MKAIFLLVALLTACQSGHKLRVIEASEQKWTGGRIETGSGTNYAMKIIAPENNQKFFIQEVCIYNQTIAFNAVPSTFFKGDTLTITGYKTGSLCEAKNDMIYYKIEEKTDSAIIQKILKKERLFYP